VSNSALLLRLFIFVRVLGALSLFIKFILRGVNVKCEGSECAVMCQRRLWCGGAEIVSHVVVLVEQLTLVAVPLVAICFGHVLVDHAQTRRVIRVVTLRTEGEIVTGEITSRYVPSDTRDSGASSPRRTTGIRCHFRAR